MIHLEVGLTAISCRSNRSAVLRLLVIICKKRKPEWNRRGSCLIYGDLKVAIFQGELWQHIKSVDIVFLPIKIMKLFDLSNLLYCTVFRNLSKSLALQHCQQSELCLYTKEKKCVRFSRMIFVFKQKHIHNIFQKNRITSLSDTFRFLAIFNNF